MLCNELLPSRFEKTILKYKKVPSELRSVIAGSSRATRLSLSVANDAERIISVVSSGMVGPLTFFFVWWVLNNAIKMGLRRLYFLARDGLILKKVAELLVNKWGLDIELRYLYCSRESLLLPSLDHVNEFELTWITWGYLSSISIEEICRRVRIELNDLAKHIPEYHFSHIISNPSSPLTLEDLNTLRKVLADPAIEKIIKEKNSDIYEAAVGYLEQKGLFNGSPFGLVDTGWRGSSQYAISSLLDKAKSRPGNGVVGFYLGINNDKWVYKNDRLFPFMFDWSKQNRDYRLYNFLCFELLFAAAHGRTLKYENRNGNFRPVLETSASSDLSPMIKLHHESAIQFADYASRLVSLSDYHKSFPGLCNLLARKLISSPTSGEASVYGKFKTGSEITERDMQCIAPEMSYIDLLMIATGRKKIKGFWPQGSMARSNLITAQFLYRIFLDMKLLDWFRKYFLKY